MGTIMQCYDLNQSAKCFEEGKHYQEAGYYEKALKEYNFALNWFKGTLKMYEADYNSTVYIQDEISLLFMLLGLVDEVKKCYIVLNEPYKSLIFQKNFEEIVTTIAEYENKLNRQQFIAYKNLSKAIESLYTESPLIASTSREVLDNLFPVADNADDPIFTDPIFTELRSNFDECCSYRRCLLPSRGVSISSSSSSCFIATAAYSTSKHPDIDTFRNFRDEKLLTNPVGKQLVNLYYQISPSIAKYVEKQPAIKSFVRKQLERLANWMRN
ncbi:CFI-box-CTERM domain-containing protein [Aerosakkonemataceae cyanobacterium BLCC-F154]|uniref:CFI-box-CTERM domain-containing protein n=1 Tax=Floridaenema fluviatile BLCC-F154 TaxID=3153640 RepID=A0ABV4YGE0_9CYAN